MTPEELFDDWLENTVVRSIQLTPEGVHVTVAEVSTCHRYGRVDFGDSEMKPATGRSLIITEHSPTDKFGWWRMEEGIYVARFNEVLKEGAPPVLLAASDRLLATGCSVHAGIFGPGELRTVLAVPSCGAFIKQNARIAIIRPLA